MGGRWSRNTGASFLRGARTLSRIEPHEEFLELCAVSSSGPAHRGGTGAVRVQKNATEFARNQTKLAAGPLPSTAPCFRKLELPPAPEKAASVRGTTSRSADTSKLTAAPARWRGSWTARTS